MALSCLVSSTVPEAVAGHESNDENEDTEGYTPDNGPGVDTIILTSILLRQEYERMWGTHSIVSKAKVGELFGSMEGVMSRKKTY